MRLVTLLLPEVYLEGLDLLVGSNMYPSRSEAIRYAVLDLLKSELWRQETEAEQERTLRKTRMPSKAKVKKSRMRKRAR